MPTTLAQAQATGRRSFGAKIDGSTNYMAADGKNHPYLAQKDNLKISIRQELLLRTQLPYLAEMMPFCIVFL